VVIDHYSMLGVRVDATNDEIEAAYRRYAAQIHPDRFFGDPKRRAQAEEKLKQLNAIMETLRDPARRAAYDDSF
jgi:curved DNA-binding protein